MKFLADENIPIKVCNRLRQEENVDIISILEIAKGAKDEEVISLAKSDNRIILTFDKDFGKLVFKKRTKVRGVIILRFTPKSLDFIFQKIRALLLSPEITLEDNFVIVEEDRIRLREIK